MKAARVRLTTPEGSPYGFPGNVAPSSAIEVHPDVPKPEVTQPGEVLIRVKASTVFRDNLEWNELYPPSHAQLGNDFSGVVAAVHPDERDFRVGDEVYGMSHAKRGGMWAEYALVTAEEAVPKPAALSWEEAAALPGSAITADQALFVHAGIETTAEKGAKQVLITGASGGVGMYMVQFAVAAGHNVTAATSSKERNGAFLKSIGAHEVVEYGEFGAVKDKFDFVVDSVGFEVLESCWGVVKPDGTLVSFDAQSWGYIDDHKSKGISKGKEGVNAKYMIAEPSRVSMARISEHVEKRNMKGLVLKTVSIDDVREAYEAVHSRGIGPGKVVVLV